MVTGFNRLNKIPNNSRIGQCKSIYKNDRKNRQDKFSLETPSGSFGTNRGYQYGLPRPRPRGAPRGPPRPRKPPRPPRGGPPRPLNPGPPRGPPRPRGGPAQAGAPFQPPEIYFKSQLEFV